MPPEGEQVYYLADTSILANIRDEHGDSEEIWTIFIQEIYGGKIRTVRQVLDELERRFPDIFKRLKPHKEVFQVADTIAYSASVVAEVNIIRRNHPGLYRQLGRNNSADPFLVAVGKELKAIVVTDEATAGPRYQSKIPYVCQQRNVGCMNRLAFLRMLGCNV